MSTLTQEDAKGCPFCGGLCNVKEIETECWGAGCEDCDYQVMSGPVGIGWFRSEHEAVRTWNVRNSDFALEFANGALKDSMARLADAQAEIARLRGAFSNLLEMVEQHADFANGVTDPTGTIDEGRVIAAEQLRKFQEVLK